MVIASSKMQEYFTSLVTGVSKAHALATRARSIGVDPSSKVDVKLAQNLAERVVGLISVVAPQIEGSGVVERIIALEAVYGVLDWRVAMSIALEIAQQRFFSTATPILAMELGIRVGFAYVTVGVVSSPLEGFTQLEVKKRRDGKEYLAIHFAGPVRNAGGTSASVCVLIADYVRKQLGYLPYDADEKECQRIYTELLDYHERVTNLQYVPSKEEVLFLLQHMPIEIAGDPSEQTEVSNFKDLPRIKTNRIRSGVCLLYSGCIPLKAPKLWKNLSKWIDAMQMEDWKFLDEFLSIQKKAKSHGASSPSAASSPVYPIYTYLEDLVGGRPVIGHPLRPGGLRLRYGRSRTSGFSAQSIHPATMYVLDNFVAIATQFKVERPGKAAAFTSCDHIDGPIVLLENGSVEYLDSVSRAKQVAKQVKSILYLGDVLICYGDFYDRNHALMPAGYCEEWWIQEVEKAVDSKKNPDQSVVEKIIHDISLNLYPQLQLSDINVSYLQTLFAHPIKTQVSVDFAFFISKLYGVALHPAYTPFFKLISKEELLVLVAALTHGRQNSDGDLLLPLSTSVKPVLEKLGIPHVKLPEDLLITSSWARVFSLLFEAGQDMMVSCANAEGSDGLSVLEAKTSVSLKDKAGIFIGARMGRPEKAKMRKMPGHAYLIEPQERKQPDGSVKIYSEHATKGVIRQKYDIHVNKDGTIRYDASEVPITHFKPREVGASVGKLKELGYIHDIYGKVLETDDQILELLAQDIVIPCCTESPNEPSDDVLVRTAKFIDEELVKLYGVEPFYNVTKREDLLGQLVFGLAPHTSAATVARIVGFTKSQGIFCHPMLHAAMRRDCDGDETCFFLLMDGFLNFSTVFLPSHRGGTMDAPLVLTSIINPSEVDDMYQNVDIVWKYPLALYEAALACKKPGEVKITLAGSTINKPEQFEGLGFTHDTSDFNEGVLCSAYKTLPSMAEKVDGQMKLAQKIVAVDVTDVAQIVIRKHFLRDIIGNMRKFSQQEFRCIKCNKKFRRPPISGKCSCGHSRIIFTVAEASVVKYLELSIQLAKKYQISSYTKQVLDILRVRADGMFGKETEKQTGLSEWL